MSFLYILSAVLLLAVGSPAASAPPATTIYLVRHAEKDLTPGLTDPPLTAAGEARARLLARRLGPRHPAALFTSDTRRARATLLPLAEATGLTPLVYNPKEPAELAARIKQEYGGKTVVVVGHSNTLLPLLSALGVAQLPADIKDDEYNVLFKVVVREGAPTRLQASRYGAAPQAANVGSMR